MRDAIAQARVPRALRSILGNALEFAAASMLVMVCACVFVGVFCRYFLDIGLGWTEEAARYLQIWLMFVGATIGVKRASHFKLSVLEPAQAGRRRTGLRVAANTAIAAFSLAMAYQGTQLVEATWEQASPMMGWRIGAIYLVVPACGLLMCAFALRNLFGAEQPQAQPHGHVAAAEAGAA